LLLGAIYVWGKYGGPTGGQFQRWLDRTITSAFPDLSNGRLSTTGRFLAGNVGLWLLIAIRVGDRCGVDRMQALAAPRCLRGIGGAGDGERPMVPDRGHR
jgi:hypothetical protein